VKRQFSEQLIARMIAYAQATWNLRISQDEAEERLRSLASLYITTSKIRARKHKGKAGNDHDHAD
jgi:hypothetical protein